MAYVVIVQTRKAPVLLRMVRVAGTVRNPTGEGLSRRVIVYKNGNETTVAGTGQSVAGSGGAFSFSVSGGPNDRFRLLAVGEDGENSAVFDHLHE